MTDFVARHAWQLASMAGLLIGSAFFSGSETALFSLSRGQLHRMRLSSGAGRIAAALLGRPRLLLNALLLANMLVNVAYAALAALIVLGMPTGLSGGLVSVAGLLVLILLGEVTPKMLALGAPERWAIVSAPLLAVLVRLFASPLWALQNLLVHPIAKMLSPAAGGPGQVTAAEWADVLALSAGRGVIDRDAGELIQEIVELSDLRVADVMTPRVDMVAHDVASPTAELVDLFKRTGRRRIPVYDGHIDNILGVARARDVLLAPAADLRGLIVNVAFVPVTANLERTLLQFRRRREWLGIVVDEYGGTAGLVTLQDILSEIVGDLPDVEEPGREPIVERIDRNRYVLDGNLAIHEWADVFGTDLVGRRISTVGGFVTLLLGRIPRVGETAAWRNLRFTVRSMRRRRIGKLLVERLEDQT